MLGGAFDYTSCPACGTSVGLESLQTDRHRCDARHLEEHAIRLAVSEIDLLEVELRDYLDSPRGRFEAFYAARSRHDG